MSWLIVLAIVTFLILVNALYVAAEFSTVSARRSRLAQLAEEGHAAARLLLPIVEDPIKLDTYVAACQIGITASSLTLGFYGQATLTPSVAQWLARIVEVPAAAVQSVVATGILLFLTFLQILLGELVPKNIGIQYPERLALLTAVPMRWSVVLFRPLIWLFNGSGRLVLRLLGLTPSAEHTHVHAPEEIQMLVEESTAGGVLDQEERRLLINTLRLRELTVRQVMVPRRHMLTAPVDRPCDELFTLLADSPYSRLPLYEGSIDNIVGVVHLKDLLCLHQAEQQDVRQVMHQAPYVPETMPVEEVLLLLQREHYHVAIVLDEYGGTAGMVTLEDLIEEIFGEIQDEFDEEAPPIQVLFNKRVRVRGDTLIEDLNEWLGLELPNEGVETIGGLILSHLGRVPQEGEEVQIGNVTFRVVAMDGKGVAAVSLAVSPEQLRRLQEELA